PERSAAEYAWLAAADHGGGGEYADRPIAQRLFIHVPRQHLAQRGEVERVVVVGTERAHDAAGPVVAGHGIHERRAQLPRLAGQQVATAGVGDVAPESPQGLARALAATTRPSGRQHRRVQRTGAGAGDRFDVDVLAL